MKPIKVLTETEVQGCVHVCVCVCAVMLLQPQTASLSVATLNLISPLSCTLITAVYANITSGFQEAFCIFMCCSLLHISLKLVV